MVFASQVKDQVPLGDGPEAVVATIRKLSGKSLDKASEARQIAQIVTARAAGADLVKLFRELDNEKLEAPPKDPAARARARYATFDRAATLTSGIEALSKHPTKADGKTSMSLPDSIEDLDQPSAELLFHKIVDLSLGPLDEVEVQAEGKGA